MNSAIKAALLVIGSLLCLYGFGWLAFSKGVRIGEAADTAIAVLVLVSAVLLPVLGFLSFRKQRGTSSYRVLFPAFLVSLAPAVIILCAVLVALLVRRPE